MELTLKSILNHLASWFVAGVGLGLGWWVGGMIKDVICKLKPAKKAAPQVLTDEQKKA